MESEVQEPYTKGNERLAERFIEDLPPMSGKRTAKHRTILRNVSSWWLRKPFEEATKQDLKAWVVGGPETVGCFLQIVGKNLTPVYGTSCFVVGSEMNSC